MEGIAYFRRKVNGGLKESEEQELYFKNEMAVDVLEVFMSTGCSGGKTGLGTLWMER